MLRASPWLALAWSLWSAAPVRAQVLEVELADTRAVRAQKKYLVVVDGRPRLRGEPVGKVRAEDDGRVKWEESGPFELYVADLEHPEDVPYRWKDGYREAKTEARRVDIPSKDVLAIRMLAPELTLDNLAAEVRERRALSERLERARNACERGSDAWFDAHFVLLEKERRLQFLLERHGFEPAARALDGELERLAQAGAAAPRATRLAEALRSVRAAETPPRLTELAQTLSHGQTTFSLVTSTHVRLVHDQRLDAERARRLVGLAEEVIEGFRREFVDPYECPDLIPERPLVEFWLGPDADEEYAGYLEQYYGLSWGTPEEKRARMGNSAFYPTQDAAPEFLRYVRRAQEEDLPGFVVHHVGQLLARVHFDADLRDGWNQAFDPDWLQEALAYYLSLEYCGANTTTCTSLQNETVSGTAVARRRETNERPGAYLEALAREAARPLDPLVLRDYGELSDADCAKGWSLLRFLAADGPRGQDVLHSACRLSRKGATFLAEWRAELGRILGVEKGDPLAELERRWEQSLPKAR